MAVYAIGDLQGCLESLQGLLDHLRFDKAQDQIWLTGDLVNRGPSSLATLRYVRDLGDCVSTVLGNHDLHLLAVAAGRGRGLRNGDTLIDILEAPDCDELLAWLRRQPLLHEDADLGWSMLHAGLPPQWDMQTARRAAREVEAALATDPDALFAAMYADQPDRWSETLIGSDRLRFSINCYTRLRYCTIDGQLLLKLKGPPATAPANALPWFAVPHRPTANQRIVFGHWSALGYNDTHNAYGLDTGCVWGGALTALRLDNAAPGTPIHFKCPGIPGVLIND